MVAERLLAGLATAPHQVLRRVHISWYPPMRYFDKSVVSQTHSRCRLTSCRHLNFLFSV